MVDLASSLFLFAGAGVTEAGLCVVGLVWFGFGCLSQSRLVIVILVNGDTGGSWESGYTVVVWIMN